MPPHRPPKSPVVCACLGVTEAEVLEAIRTHKLAKLKDIIEYTSAGDGCTSCHPLLREYLEREHRKHAPTA